MLMNIIVLLVGFVFLIKGADFFVDGSASLASKFKVPAMIIGLTIVAMGTSAPELAVSLTSSLAGQNDMSVANVIGSNMFNILIVLGMSSMIRNLPVKINTLKEDIPFLMFMTILLLLFAFNGTIVFVEGFIMLFIFAMFIKNAIKDAKKNKIEEVEEEEYKKLSITEIIFYIIGGLVLIVVGGNLVVNSATKIATALGMSENLIGLTVVAFGTSLPELVTSVIATKKGEVELAIGNVIGSNIFNILLILGSVSVINPITVSTFAFIDIIASICVTVLLQQMISRNKDHSITKYSGLCMILVYISYIAYTIIR